METYYRYLYGNKSVFGAIDDWEKRQTNKRPGKKWAKENKRITNKINRKISWLPEPKKDKKVKYYFKQRGAKKYEKTLFKTHRKILNPEKIKKKEFNFFRKQKDSEVYIFDENNEEIGKTVYEDKYQIGIKRD